MDYQFVLVLLWACLNSVSGIIGRDLVLTPKHGLQLYGKSIYYEEDASADLRNQSDASRPWERTLKHVTFVTLFTDAAAGAVAGNVSQLKAYNDFLHTPYISQRGASDARFGDIVTLATGRLEVAANGGNDNANNATAAYRFVEGGCDYSCAAGEVRALWQVQKIRHRDATNRKFRYEIKFSISPLGRAERSVTLSGGEGGGGGGGGANKRWANDESNRRENSLQIFIQKEDDYPQSFGRIIYPDEEHEYEHQNTQSFSTRRQDDEFNAGRNFRHVPHDYNRYQTPIPQATFMRGIFQLPPPPPEKLNIGEQYLKGYPAATVGKAASKIELFPNLFNAAHRQGAAAYTQHAHTPTTYRPNYQVKFPRPEIYQPPSPQLPPLPHELMRYPPPPAIVEHTATTAAAAAGGKPGIVTHHFHHHFYMPSSNSLENGLHSGEQTSTNSFQQAAAAHVKSPTPPQYYANYGGGAYDESQLPPAPQKFVFPVPSSVEDDENELQFQQHTLVHVTPPSVPPLRKPQIYQSMYHHPQPLPLLIYPAPVDEVTESRYEFTSPRSNKPFVQSEPIDDHSVRYSEPDPLYISNTSNAPRQKGNVGTGIGAEAEQSYELIAPQLEAPTRNKIVGESVEKYTPNSTTESSKTTLPDPAPPNSIVAQLPPPDKNQDVRIPYVDEGEPNKGGKSQAELTTESVKVEDLEQKSSLKDESISTEKSNAAAESEIDAPPQSATLLPATTTTTTTTTNQEITSANQNKSEILNTFSTSSSSSSLSTGQLGASSIVSPVSKFKYRNSIVSTSTTESPLRAVSRHRGSGGYVPPRTTTSTTEAPVLKWKPRRKANYTRKFKTSNSFAPIKLSMTGEAADSRAKSSERHEEKLPSEASDMAVTSPQNDSEATVSPTSQPTTPQSLLQQSEAYEILEVLTQKSVSKSVSIKVGSNGEEVPIITDDDDDDDENDTIKEDDNEKVKAQHVEENEVRRE